MSEHSDAIEMKMDEDCIQLYSGIEFKLHDPEFDIEDIAHALGMTCRYNGHCRHFYSVAEHSVIVSLLMEELKLGDPFEGLMHDATEAYLMDMPRPWKKMMPEYRHIEGNLERYMRTGFGLPEEKTHGCSVADNLALFIEAWYLMPDRGESYGDPLNVRGKAIKLVEAGWRTVNLYPPEATAAWHKRYAALGPRMVQP